MNRQMVLSEALSQVVHDHGSPLVHDHGCPTLAAFLFLRLGWDGKPYGGVAPLTARPPATPPKPPAPGDGVPTSPMMQVGEPRTITPPCTVGSPSLAAGRKLIITPVDPMTIMSGGPTQVAMLVTVAAGRKQMRTGGAPRG